MKQIPGLKRPNHKSRLLFIAFVVAALVNVGVLLIIGGLITQREIALENTPELQVIDFVKIKPRQEPPAKPLPKPDTPKIIEDAAPSNPVRAEKPTPRPTKPDVQPKPKPAKPKKPHKPRPAKPGVAPPKVDIPKSGTGTPMAGVAGSDSRILGPPSQWNPEKTPDLENETGHGDDVDANGWSKTPLVVLSRVLPEYPPRARIQRKQGWVRLEITVSEQGKVIAAKVVAAKPKGLFDQEALDAIKKWRFQPAYRNGRPVQRRAAQEIKFRLEAPR